MNSEILLFGRMRPLMTFLIVSGGGFLLWWLAANMFFDKREVQITILLRVWLLGLCFYFFQRYISRLALTLLGCLILLPFILFVDVQFFIRDNLLIARTYLESLFLSLASLYWVPTLMGVLASGQFLSFSPRDRP